MSRPSPAMAVALLALFVALGGSSYAALKVGSKQITNNSIRSKDLRNNDVRSTDVRDHSLLSKDFKAGQLPAGPAGSAGPQGVQGPPGPVAVYEARTAFDPGGPFLGNGTFATVHTLNVPSGSYDIRASIVAANQSAGIDGAVCDILPPGVPGERFDETSPTGTSLSASADLAVTLPSGGAIKLSCTANNTGTGSVRRVQSSLTALKVESVIKQ